MKILLSFFFTFSILLTGQSQVLFPCSALSGDEDLSNKMLIGMHNYLDRKITEIAKKRAKEWSINFSESDSLDKFIALKRNNLSRIIGVIESRANPVIMEFISNTTTPSKIAENKNFNIFSVRWMVFDDIYGEGLLLQPKKNVAARVVAIPDADQIPETLAGILPGLSPEMQYARILAENGCQVIIPTLINRSCNWSGSSRLNRFTNQPHREWIYRQAYTFGRHLIGYEVQKILAATDWFGQQNTNEPLPIGIIGWGEGGLLGFYSAALDTKIDVTLISGYFSKRENLWKEPIYRNLSGLLTEFSDAEIACLITPRKLIIEYSNCPEINGPPIKSSLHKNLRISAAPGQIITPPFCEVKWEVDRLLTYTRSNSSSISFIHDNGKITQPVSKLSINNFLQNLHVKIKKNNSSGKNFTISVEESFNTDERQYRQVIELENHTQQLIEKSRHSRDEFFWNKLNPSTPEVWRNDITVFRNYFLDNIIGRIEDNKIPINPKARQIYNEASWTGYEVTLDILPDIFLWGYLLLPKNIKIGDKRPVIVVQHGLNGIPSVVMDLNNNTYKALAVQLVERGYIVFAPHFPWRSGHDYRNIQRKANPIGLTVFSFIYVHHERLLEWLTSLPWVDPSKIGFYGLSWGGKVAVRVPALLEGYSLSVCSGDFNEWIWKNATTDWPGSYMFSPEYEMFDFNLGVTFNYGEIAALIAPRAFMVERGHNDGVGIDEWVAFEYAKVNRLYDKLNIPHYTEIEYFNGGHEINGKKTFQFIERHFGKPD